jgi:NADP-dependent 3-hydroxy acid dehydrogenase YdfG
MPIDRGRVILTGASTGIGEATALLEFLGGLRMQGAFHRRAVPGCWS